MLMGNTNEPTICVYCDTWAQGGIEAFLTQALLHMDLPQAHLRLLCAEKRSSGFDAQLAEKGLTVCPLLAEKGMGALKKTLGAALPLVRFCRQEHVTVVHLNVFHGVSLIQAFLLKLSGVPRVIVHCHGAGLRKSRNKGLKLLGHWLCRGLLFWTADERWAASQQAARFLFGRCPAQIIPNGIAVERFLFDPRTRSDMRKRVKIDDGLLLGCVGRLDAQKNQQFLLPLLTRLKAYGRTAKLLLLGDGEARQALKQQAETMGLIQDVLFLGVSDQVSAWMCAMDALLVPSTSEGLSVAALEGQAAGLPVFCSTGVPPEVKVTETVFFLPLSAPGQWVDALEHLPVCDRAAANRRMEDSPYNAKNTGALLKRNYLER